MLTFHVSMGVSVAQHVLESECNVEISDSAKMTKKSAAREQAVRPWLFPSGVDIAACDVPCKMPREELRSSYPHVWWNIELY